MPLGDGTRTGAFVSMRVSPPSGFLVFREAPGTPVVLTLRPTGGLAQGQVSTIDQEQLLAQAVDEAGNESQAVQVRRFRLFVNPGRTANFTHVATTADLSTPARHEQAVAVPALEAAEGLTLSVAPQPRWELLHDGLDAGLPSFAQGVSLIEDTPRRRLLRVVSDPFTPRVVRDLSAGHGVLTNVVLPTARYLSACHTSRRTCLLVGNQPSLPMMGNQVLWLLDDQGVRQLRVLVGPPASVTFDPRREVFLLAQGTQLFTLDESGSILSTGSNDCTHSLDACHVLATPAGLLSAQNQFVWRQLDGGSFRVTGSVGPNGHLILDRSRLEVFIVDNQITLLRPDGGTSMFARCSSGPGCEAGWDPIGRSLVLMDQQLPDTLNDGGGSPDFFPSSSESHSWAIDEPNGFVVPSSRWRYDERTGWTQSIFPSHCPLQPTPIAPLGVRVDGGWASPCGRRVSLTEPDGPIPNFPSGSVVTLGDQFVFSNALWRDGVTTMLFRGLLPTTPIAIPPNRLVEFNATRLYLISADGGVQSNPLTLRGLLPEPGSVPFMPTSANLPLDGWLWGRQSTTLALSRLTFHPDFTVDSTNTAPLAPVPDFRSTPIVVERPGRFLLFGGSTGSGSSLRNFNDVWALHTATRPTVHWSVDTSRLNVSVDSIVGVQVSTTVGGGDAGTPRVELLAWDPWRASWSVLAALDGGSSGSGSFVPVSRTFDVAVSALPTGRDSIEVDRLEAVIDYVK